MKIAAVTCYSNPDYIRARNLRTGLKANPAVRLTVVKNSHRGWLRYPEVFWQLLKLRYEINPDVYLLTFRGQEILPVVLWLAGRRPVIFDEFVVPISLAKRQLPARSLAAVLKRLVAILSQPFYRHWLRRCHFVLADTPAYAEFSARLSHVNLRQYRVIPIGADEGLLKPNNLTKPEQAALPFQVFFYTKSWTSTDLQLVLAAAEALKNQLGISFLITGGGKSAAEAIEASVAKGAHLTYQAKIASEDLPDAIQQSALALAGPFSEVPVFRYILTDKAYQYLACGVPTVLGQNEASSALFTDKDSALLVPPGDAEALVRLITWASSHRSELVDIGRGGQQVYERSLSQAYINGELSNLLAELS